MSLHTKDTGDGDFQIVSEGLHQALCNAVVDLGQQSVTWNEESKVKAQVFIRWELPTELMEDGRPMVLGRIYTNSLSKKANLRRDLEGWRGRSFTAQELDGFDLSTVLGKPCQLTVTHNTRGDRTYANVGSIVPWPTGMEIPQPANPLLLFDVDNPHNVDELPEWLRTKIQNRVMPGGHTNEYVPTPTSPDGRVEDSIDDSIPF